MALHGDFSSYPLPELLQWLDGSRKTGTLQLVWEGGDRRLFMEAGYVVAMASEGLRGRISHVLAMAGLARGEEVLAAFRELTPTGEEVDAPFAARKLEPRLVRELAREELFGAMMDLTQAGHGAFHWTEDVDRSDEEWAPSEMSLRELLFESLRWLDEQGDVDRALPGDGLMVRALVPAAPSQPLMHRILLAVCAGGGQNLGRLRLTLGMSRSVITRRVFELLRAKQVEVQGAQEVELNPVADMLEKGAVLVREGQYDAAGLVGASLLASDPSDRRVREFARLVLTEHVAALYAELPPLSVPVLAPEPETLSLLKPEERQLVGMVNGQWDVSTLVLASPMRELETLKTLARLTRLGLLQVYAP